MNQQKSEKRKQLAEELVFKDSGIPLNRFPKVEASGEVALKMIWPLGARFKQHAGALKKLQYHARYEADADKAIEEYVTHDAGWDHLTLPVLRVLYERFIQLIALYIAHEKQGEKTILPPPISEEGRVKFLTVFWLYGMILPFPAGTQALLELAERSPDQPGLQL